MKAMILAAGLGTRLQPFTASHPKALYEVNGKTLLEYAIGHLKTAGIREVIINVHHFSQQIVDYLHGHDNFGMQIAISDESAELLETGGGLKKSAWFFTGGDCAVIRNVDILSDLDLSEMATHHLKNNSIATLAVRNRETSRYFLFNERMQLCGWENRKTGDRQISRNSNSLTSYAFSGIQIISRGIFPLITETGKFSLTELYLRLAISRKIIGYREAGTVWEDVGK